MPFRLLLGTLLALVLALSAPVAAEGPAPSPAEVTVARGDTVPPFEAEGVDGVVRKVEFPKGTPTVLMFFTSGCPTCRRMIPEWNRMYERRPKNLAVVGILMDREPPGFFQAMQITFPVLRAPSRAMTEAYKIKRVPVTIRVDPGGKVEDVIVGYVGDPIRLGEMFRQ